MGTITRSIANNIVTGGKIDGTDGLNGAIPASNIDNNSLSSITALSPSLGTAITSVSSDPPAPAEGQLWYNSSSGTLKGYVYATVNAWAAGGNYPVAINGNAAAGTQNATVSWTGYGPIPYTTAANLYNGSAWTATGSVNRGMYYSIGAGTQTATIKFGGESTTASYDNYVETFNGSTWTTNPATLNNGRSFLSGCGTQTAALAVCGQIPPSGAGSNYTEKWNGTSWTSSGNYPASTYGVYAFGSQTASIASGGVPASTTSNSFNGTSWTSIPSLNTARYMHGGAGTATAGLVFGGIGSPGSVISATELYNGTSWTSNPTGLATARRNVGAAGSQTAGLFTCGDAGTANTASTEEWTGTTLQTKTITVS